MARDISVYQRELTRQQDRAASRGSKSSGGDYQWFSPAKPTRKGEKTRTQVRILPRAVEGGGPDDYADEWWVVADQHVLTVDGRTRVFNCPDDHDSGGDSHCPLCILRRDMYKERSPAAQELAKDLKVRSRAFAVIACPDAEGERGPFVWGFSSSLLNGIMEIAVAKRCMVDDPDTGRDLLVTITRIGPKRYDIRYSVTDLDPSAVADDVRAMETPDLNGLTKDASMDDLRELAAMLDPRPGGKRSSAAPAPAHESNRPDPTPPRHAAAKVDPPVVRDVDTSLHYSGSGGDQQGLTVEDVAVLVADNGGDEHYVWREGYDAWKPASEVREIVDAVARLKPAPIVAAPPSPPSAPPKPPGPPRPPKPPGGKAF